MPLETQNERTRKSLPLFNEGPEAGSGKPGTYAKKMLTKYIDLRKKAADEDNEKEYMRLTDQVKFWSDKNLHEDAKLSEDDEPTPNILKQAGEQFNNLK